VDEGNVQDEAGSKGLSVLTNRIKVGKKASSRQIREMNSHEDRQSFPHVYDDQRVSSGENVRQAHSYAARDS